MPKPAAHLSDIYISRLRRFDRARLKVEKLYSDGIISRDDAYLFYEGIFLRTVTTLEGLIEDLFVGLLAGSIRSQGVYPRVAFRSHVVARDVMLGGRSYVDWLPYGHTEKRAEAFFRSGLPFCKLEKSDRKQLEQIITIRNAVAHQSRSALAKFEREVIGTTPLLASERTPAGYLRSVFRTTPDQTRYEDLANSCAALARKLCS